MNVVVVGSSNTDLVVTAPRLPGPGETVLGGDLVTAAGGKGANQAVAAGRLGARVTFVARLGQDMFGHRAARSLESEGLDLRFLVRDAVAPSGVALIVVEPGGQNLIAVASGANGRLSPGDVAAAAEAFNGARVILLQLETSLDTVLAAAQAGRRAGATVILNPAPAQPLSDEMLAAVDVLTPNETEARLLTGAADPAEAARALLARGPHTVIVTLGRMGVLLATRSGEVRQIDAFKVEAVDTTGAGDAFNGALGAALARDEPLAAAVRYAQAAAALSVTRLGAQPSLPSGQEVEDFMDSIGVT